MNCKLPVANCTMSNNYFQFKQFLINQDKCAMKVTTDACLFGAWTAERIRSLEFSIRSQSTKIKNVLDIGTGTGLLSLMFAQKNPDLDIDAIEIDEGAAWQAKENFAGSPWKDRINIINADVKNYPFVKKYGIIISNPPFYESELKGDNEKKNLAYHDKGLLIPDLLSMIKKILLPDGVFYLLLPFKRNKEVKELVTRKDFYISSLLFVRQSTDHNYFRILLEGKFKKENTGETTIDEIAIMNGSSGDYTPAFKKLLGDYYLHF